MPPSVRRIVAEYDGVVTFFLGAQPVVHDLRLVQELEVAVLLGDGGMRAQPVYRNLGSRRRRPIEDALQNLAVAAVA